MLYRKIEKYIEDYLKSDSNKVLIIDGARQIGKTFIIRYVGKKLFPNFIEINHLLTLLKFLKQDNKFTYIASGSLLGVTLSKTTSIPIGSIEVKHMFPLDFEEFLIANDFNYFAIQNLYKKFINLESLDESVHLRLMDLFKKYLLVGGLPDAVNCYLADKNIVNVRTIQNEIHEY